jgi:hypothetical protein
MSSSPERQAGTSGSTMGYEQGQGQGQTKGQAQGQVPGQAQERDIQAQERDYRPAGREYPPGARHATGARRGAVIGLTAVAGTLMLLGGLWMVAIAIVALSHSAVITTAPAYIFRFNPIGWGWLELGLGVLLFASGMCVFLGMAWARYVGAFFAVLSAVANFVFIPYQPAWSIIMIALDAAIIWALLTPRRTAQEF